MTRPIQRVGHIGDTDNRFCGAPVFAELAGSTVNSTDLLARAFGMPMLSDDDREVLRCIALAAVSPDARVWPLKMTRTLSSYGNPFAGFFGAQLGTASDRMGPGTASSSAASLAWIRARVGDEPSDQAVAAAVTEHLASEGRIPGFGVPMRAEDERLLGLRQLLAGHPAMQRPYWRLSLQVIAAVRAGGGPPPNVVIALATLLLDLGLPAHRAGMFVTMVMAPTFAAHALEASEQDAAALQEITAVDDRTTAPRRTAAAAAADRVPVGGSAMPARRSLAW